MTCLAILDYPAGDERLRPLVRRVHDWLFSKHFLEPPMTAIYPGQQDRVRHCASMDGNAIWYSVRLGLEESKWLPGGGFPLQAPNTVTADHVVSRGSYADWGPSGLRRSNHLVSLAALCVLRAAT